MRAYRIGNDRSGKPRAVVRAENGNEAVAEGQVDERLVPDRLLHLCGRAAGPDRFADTADVPAMSTKSTCPELTPNSWCTSWAFASGTATTSVVLGLGPSIPRRPVRNIGRSGLLTRDQLAASSAPLVLGCLSGRPSARRCPFDPFGPFSPFGPLADACARASSRLVKLGMMWSTPVIVKTRSTALPGMTSS